MNLFARSAAHMELTPAERALLRFLENLVIVFLLSATPVFYAALSTGDVGTTDWGIVLNTALATGAAAVANAVMKYLSAVQDVAKGHTVAVKSPTATPAAPAAPAAPAVPMMYLGSTPPANPKNGDVWMGTLSTPATLPAPAPVAQDAGVGTLPITQFWQTVSGVDYASTASSLPISMTTPTGSSSTNAENVLNQPSPNVPAGVTAEVENGMVASVPVSSEAGAPNVTSDAPTSAPGV